MVIFNTVWIFVVTLSVCGWENGAVVSARVFTDLSVGASLASSTVWACALLSDGDNDDGDDSIVECFTPARVPSGDGVYYETQGTFRGSGTRQPFQSVATGGAGSTVWLCATTTTTGTDKTAECTRIRYEDGMDVEATIANAAQLDIGGVSSSVYSCVVTPTGGLGCLLLNYSPDEAIPFRATVENVTDVQQVSVGAAGSTSSYACFISPTNLGGVGCLRPSASSTGTYEIIGVLPGNYAQVSVNGAKSLSVDACAINQDTGNVDCWSPDSHIIDEGVYQVKGRLATGLTYSRVSLGGGSSTIIYACAIAVNQIDCFSTSSATDVNGNHIVSGRLEGSYSKVSLEGGSTSSTYACALHTSGTQIDCFSVSSAPQDDDTYEIFGSYILPTPAPTFQPTVSPAPTAAPTTFPTRAPVTLSPTPSSVTPGSGKALLGVAIGTWLVVGLYNVI